MQLAPCALSFERFLRLNLARPSSPQHGSNLPFETIHLEHAAQVQLRCNLLAKSVDQPVDSCTCKHLGPVVCVPSVSPLLYPACARGLQHTLTIIITITLTTSMLSFTGWPAGFCRGPFHTHACKPTSSNDGTRLEYWQYCPYEIRMRYCAAHADNPGSPGSLRRVAS